MKKIARPRRLFVSGGSQLSPNAALLWRELGVLLAAQDGLTLITGGLKSIANAPDGQTADRMMTEGFLEGLRQHHVDAFERVETMLPDPKLDWNNLTRFEVGRVEILRNRSAQARRFRMVYSSDVVIAIEGDQGTRSVLDVALAIERPILPLPFAGGTSKDVWNEEKQSICGAFQLTPEEAHDFEQISLSS